MAGSANGNGWGHGRGTWRARLRHKSDINVTPMVDVMLVCSSSS